MCNLKVVLKVNNSPVFPLPSFIPKHLSCVLLTGDGSYMNCDTPKILWLQKGGEGAAICRELGVERRTQLVPGYTHNPGDPCIQKWMISSFESI